MTLPDAAWALNELAEGRFPNMKRAWAGLNALERAVQGQKDNRELVDAAARLELFLATGDSVDFSPESRANITRLAAAVQKASSAPS